MSPRLTNIGALTAVILFSGVVWGQQAISPRAVSVLPVFFVPKGEEPPSDDEAQRLMRHLDWSQTRYRELLGNHTFTVAKVAKPHVYRSDRALVYYRGVQGGAVVQMAAELLTDLKFTRYNCPYVMLSVMMCPKDDFPTGAAAPLNGGFSTGGGIIGISSFALNRIPNVQSTIQHELGHAFGLNHVDVYGYDMGSNDSIMSYNLKHHTKEFTPSATPGKLIPEDVRGLALNQRVFPKLQFNPAKDIPKGYTLKPMVPFQPLKLSGHPDGIKVTTDAGEEYRCKVSSVVRGQIAANKKIDGKVTFDINTMWHSAKLTSPWATLELTFPYEVELTRIVVYSQHSGEYHAATAGRVSVQEPKGAFRIVGDSDLQAADAAIPMPRTKGQVWRLELKAGASGYVTVRGLRFFFGNDELFPLLVPYRP